MTDEPERGDQDKGKTAAERARERIARREANQAEREARRTARQDERGAGPGKQPKKTQPADKAEKAKPADKAEKAEKAKPAGHAEKVKPAGEAKKVKPAEKAEPVPAEPVDPAALQTRFNLLVVAQAGRLEREAALFAASLRRSSPDWRGRLIVAVPRQEGPWSEVQTRLSPAATEALESFGAEITPFTSRHFGANYPHGNKIEALALLPADEPFIFFDSDMLVTGPLNRLGIDFRRPTASMQRTGTWPIPPLYGPGYGDIWKSLYDRFGLDYESSLDFSQPDEHWERYLYFNAGWFLGPDPAKFGKRFLDWAVQVRNDPGEALASQSLEPWLDQAVLPLVIHSFKGGRPDMRAAALDGRVACHYRTLSLLYAREPDATIDLFEDLMQNPLLVRVFNGHEPTEELFRGGLGRKNIRPLFEGRHDMAEQQMRRILKREGLWYR